MKKVLSFALVLAMILGSVSMAFAAKSGYPDTKGIDAEEAINVLTGLGVIEGYEDGTFKPEKSVTRAEMVKMIIAALNMPVKEGVYNTQFVDVAPTAWYSAYVSYGVTLGIIEGKSATIFDPKGNVTYDQAITMVMRALGYTEASLNGVYPACFVSKAVSLGAMKNLHSGSGDANRADCAQLIFNVLQSPIGKVGTDNIWVAFGYGAHEDNTEDNMLIRLGADLFQGNTNQHPVAQRVNKTNYYLVDEKLIEDEDTLIDLTSLLGNLITFYVNEDGELVAIAEVLTTELSGKYLPKKDTIADTKFTSNYDWAKDETCTTFVNGVKEAFDVKDETAYTWVAIMKNGKIDDIVSVLDWQVTAAMKITESELETITDDEPSLLGVDFALTDDDEIDTESFTLVGVDALSDIEEDNIVYVYERSDKNTIVKVEVGTKTVEGTIDEVLSNGKAVVADTTYSLSGKKGVAMDDECVDKAAMLEFKKAGGEYTAFLDAAGKLYSVTAITNNAGYAVFLKYQAADEDKTIDGSVAKIQVFDQNGETKVYELKKDEDLWDVAEGCAAGQLVKLTLNSAGTKITKINTELGLNKATVSYEDGEEAVINKKGVTENNELLVESTIVFVFNGDEDDDLDDADNWSIGAVKSLFGTEPEVFAAVYKSETDLTVKVAITGGYVTEAADYVVLTGWSELANEMYKIKVLENGEAASYKSEEKFTNGDSDMPTLWKLSLNADGTLKNVEAFADDEDKGTFTATLEVTGTAITVVGGDKIKDADGNYYTLADDFVVYVWDDEDAEWSVGKLANLNGLKDSAKNEVSYVKLFDTIEETNPVEEYNYAIIYKNMAQ